MNCLRSKLARILKIIDHHCGNLLPGRLGFLRSHSTNYTPCQPHQKACPQTVPKIRTVTIAGEIWFYGTDVCQALEITNSGNAYSRLESDDIRTMDGVDATGRKAKLYLVREYGLYDLILQSRKTEAKKFKRWVTHDVIPQIRKTGSFSHYRAIIHLDKPTPSGHPEPGCRVYAPAVWPGFFFSFDTLTVTCEW